MCMFGNQLKGVYKTGFRLEATICYFEKNCFEKREFTLGRVNLSLQPESKHWSPNSAAMLLDKHSLPGNVFQLEKYYIKGIVK